MHDAPSSRRGEGEDLSTFAGFHRQALGMLQEIKSTFDEEILGIKQSNATMKSTIIGLIQKSLSARSRNQSTNRDQSQAPDEDFDEEEPQGSVRGRGRGRGQEQGQRGG